MTIKFGTDGWRAVISDTFTFNNLRLVAQAIADVVLEGSSAPVVVVGFDTRFLSDRYAIEVARVLAANGIRVHLTNSDAPTPAVSYAVVARHAHAGVMITASHNAPRYNGVKLKAAYGGSATPLQCREIETRLDENEERARGPNLMEYEAALHQGLVQRFDPAPAYHAHLRSLLDMNALADCPLHVIVDPMHGAGRGYIKEMLRESTCRIQEIRGEMNPGFGGVHPEPIEPYLAALIKAVTSNRASLGLASDGDADRIGAVDERGQFVDPHRIFALILRYLVEQRGWRGAVVKTVSTTRMVDRLAARYHLPLYETPVGFNYIADLMLQDDVLIGGEESGGISIKGHIPEGDGILSGLLLLEIIARSCMSPLHALIEDLLRDVGPAHYARRDLRLVRPVAKAEMVKRLTEGAPPRLAGQAVVELQQMDGVKYLLADDAWLLIRPSGTEPVLRVYAEAPDAAEVAALLQYGEQVAAA